jgi:hypothetical protein
MKAIDRAFLHKRVGFIKKNDGIPMVRLKKDLIQLFFQRLGVMAQLPGGYLDSQRGHLNEPGSVIVIISLTLYV